LDTKSSLVALMLRQWTGALAHMNALITLVAAVAGASIALAGQYLTRRGEVRTRTSDFVQMNGI
jgi:hypothetical protein